MATPPKFKILIVNPNSSKAMTEGMISAISNTTLSENLEISAYTAPSIAPASIDDDAGIRDSTQAVLIDIMAGKFHLTSYDSILVACFSVHILVEKLSALTRAPVTGIFEASILTSLSLTTSAESWGIVTTGAFWERHLGDGVNAFLGQTVGQTNARFAGTFSSGLTAGDFHTVSPEQVQAKLKDATVRLLQASKVRCVVMGCGGMAGLESIIRGAAVEVYGKQRGESVYIVDGVRAGVLQLHQTMLSRREFA
ncbi:Asp/Glu/hydantoin racemase [Cordyceps fumosorosea ARSEF 2679]|uniref:Asp/Glu/hydantoin racemase n=1 Tax=Cordyceps fumosorosea (strain ARSEF 2679) TaxID=1081104 RepID=A0A167PNB0_CORFA|nr:Asp/Glu/hydantoin racemase [Cordyceps fumosorosea ARSEF 2679]OAA56847.1 Asp/Glu/hydantoin racemase [Cordyceps fumosorosea ARSEF 2679]